MKVDKYLVISSKRVGGGILCGQVRITTQKPSLKSNERAIKLEIDLPDALFKIPELVCKVTVPIESVTTVTIPADVQHNIKEVMQKELGINMTIQVVEAEEDV